MVLLSGLIVFPFIWFPAQFVNIGFKVITLYAGFYVGTFIVQAIRKARN
jgi:mannose/fructose/N-acetylgalactosamine-specific phosphotransferase system component IID